MKHDLECTIGDLVVIRLPDGRIVEVKLVRPRAREIILGVDAPRDVPVFRREILARAWKEVLA